MYRDLTKGKISSTLILFALPMIGGNLLQQFYNIADTLIVGRVIGRNALAAVGSAYTLMTFLTSVFLGLSMGSGALFSIYYGQNRKGRLRLAILHSLVLIMAVTLLVNILVFVFLDPILTFMHVPDKVRPDMKIYLEIIFVGLIATSLYNYCSCMLRALGNSLAPLVFLGISSVVNIGLDLLFIAVFRMGVKGAAAATVIAQYISAVGILLYTIMKCREFLPGRHDRHYNPGILKEITKMSSLTCVQQSVMNFGILMVQGLVNSFGPVTMAAFAAAVKIDTFAYLPVQDFGNAFSTFVAQNYGAGQHERIRRGTKEAFGLSMVFCIVISAVVFIFARQLMGIFVKADEIDVIASGVRYLRIEGAFYIGIGWLFLLYGYFRAIKKAGMSVVLTVISLGMRVCAANRKERASWPPYIFEPRLFSGVQVGGLKHMRSVNTVGDFALNYSGQFYVGYHLGPYVSLKAAIEYETLNENKYGSYVVDFMGVEKQFTALWQYRYNLLNIKLAYMLNLSNVYQKYDLNRKFNLFVEGGALYSKCMSDNARIYSGELEVGSSPRPLSAANPGGAPALLLGAVAQYRINDQWSLLLEPEVHYYLKNGFIGGEVLSPFNDVVAKVSLGTSYTF